MNKIPDNYRKLKSNELLRKGDLYSDKNNRLAGKMDEDTNDTPYPWPEYTFWRRRHTKQPKVQPTIEKTTKKVPIVSFIYNIVRRKVQLISLDDNYLKGIEITFTADGKKSYQFKSFKRNKISRIIELVSYEPSK